MKKTCILFCFILLNFGITFSQNATIEILNDQSLSLEDVFDLIKSKTDYQFVYRHDLIKDAKKIKVKKGLIEVKDLLKKGLDPISCTYEFSDDVTIILSRKTSTKKTRNNTPRSKQKTIIKARVLDNKTKQPIAYANIGFIKKRIGTISNEKGYFILEYDEAKLSASEILQISTLGYKTLKISLDQLSIKLSQNNILYLNPEPFALDEVMLTNEKRKEVRVGNTRANTKTIGYWRDEKALGGEIATKINIKKKNTKLLDFKFNIVENRSDSLKVRVNVYDYAKRYPTKKLLTQNIFHTIKQKEGVLTIDLKPYDIRVDDDIIISIELVKVYGNVIDFSVSGEPHAGVAFKRYISQDKWERFELIGMNFSLLTSVVVNNKIEKESVVPTVSFEKPDVIAQSLIAKKDETTKPNNINGRITYLNSPIPDVNVAIKGSRKGTKTDADGNYRLKARIGDVLEYSHVSFRTVNIVVEDVTSTLNIEMAEKENKLDEVVIKTEIERNNTSKYNNKKGGPIMTAVGVVNPENFSGSLLYFDRKNLLNTNDSFTSFWNKMYAGTDKFILGTGSNNGLRSLPSTWDVDGIIYQEEPPINFNRVIDIHVIDDGATKWGTTGGVVIIRTLDSPFIKAQELEKIAEQHRNQNYYQDDAKQVKPKLQTTSQLDEESKAIILKDIYGIVTTNELPLRNVNIKVLDSPKGTVTNSDGSYKLKVRVGDEIQFSYQGLHKVNIIIEDVTTELNIDMVSLTNSLDEVVIIAKNIKGEVVKRAEKAERKFTTSRGDFDPKKLGYSIGYIDGEKVNFSLYASLKIALVGKVAGLSIDRTTGKVYLRGKYNSVLQDYPAAWEVDGNFTTEEPVGVDLNTIKDIHFLKGLASTNKYGTLGAGGVIVITTNMSDSNTNQTKNLDHKFTNSNFYANDASSINDNFEQSAEILALKEQKNRAFAYNFYKKNMQNQINDYDIHIKVAKLFAFHFKDTHKATEILVKLSKKHNNNSEILKTIAYNLETINAKRDAVKTYETIFKLRPKYAQSYRDLANAYVENDQFKKAWRLYMGYLSQGNNVSDEGIGQIIYNEMEYLYFNRKNQTKIKETFKPKSKDLFDFRNDVRMVFEWNTSEAEFDLEFVSPDKRSYVFNHSLYENQNLITDEKIKGYSSKDFIIDDVGLGEWLVNITYKGNKKPEPTYVKLTTYYHWGKPNQKKEISLYSFKNEREKIQLVKINKQSLLTSK